MFICCNDNVIQNLQFLVISKKKKKKQLLIFLNYAIWNKLYNHLTLFKILRYYNIIDISFLNFSSSPITIK